MIPRSRFNHLALASRAWLLGALVFSILVLSACGGPPPEEKLVKHLKSLTEIMNNSKKNPRRGVVALRKYMHKHLPDMLEQMGHLTVELQKIEDDDARRERVSALMELLAGPLANFASSAKEFSTAVAKDDEAKAELVIIFKRFEMISSAFSATEEGDS